MEVGARKTTNQQMGLVLPNSHLNKSRHSENEKHESEESSGVTSKSEARRRRKLARLSQSLEDLLDDKETKTRPSYCLNKQISKRRSYEEALLGGVHQVGDGQNFQAEFVVTCRNGGKRIRGSYPVTLCYPRTDHQSGTVSEMEFKRWVPWTGHIDNCHVGLFPCCRVQLVIRHVEDGSIAQVFLLSLDLEDMPADSKTIVRQTGTCHFLESSSFQSRSDPIHLLQFVIHRDSSRQISIGGRVRLVVAMTRPAGQGKPAYPTGIEEFMQVTTSMPDNPKYFAEKSSRPAGMVAEPELSMSILR